MKTTANKTIIFKQKEYDEKKQTSKYKIKNNNSSTSSKVIPYPKYKKKKEKSIKLIKNNKPLLIILLLVMFFFLLSFIDNNLLRNKPRFNSSSSSLSNSEFSSYSKIVENEIRHILTLGSKDKVATDSMHKNGESVYAEGNISLKKKENKDFDMILKENKPYSLLIDGTEYIK
ncbi:hypothetical protein QOZ84_10390 [Romboutsia sedimentorum]|uniref:Uncharacterized protein n=1 Tax=Romboutsia sedimentorum TaxID=1368474 RepID=A0ABT7EAM0_9FIRM|nr:hypothetical protein [Romboutsia sedimentorum]MDK2563960.1 hypothetical protein [Romboutsia sedimentorum]